MNTWKRDLKKECGQQFPGTAAWRKMEAAAQDRAGWRQVVCGLSPGAKRLK